MRNAFEILCDICDVFGFYVIENSACSGKEVLDVMLSRNEDLIRAADVGLNALILIDEPSVLGIGSAVIGRISPHYVCFVS